MVTVIALLYMTTKRCSSAKLDRGHDATLRGGQRSAMTLAKGFTVAAEYVRHFEPEPAHSVRAQKGFRGAASGSGGRAAAADRAAQPHWWRFEDIGLRCSDFDDQAIGSSNEPEKSAEEWLLIEWSEGDNEPTKYWLSTLPGNISFRDLVDAAKLR